MSDVTRELESALQDSIKGFASPTSTTANSPIISSSEPQTIADLSELSEVLSHEVVVSEENAVQAEELKTQGNARLIAKDFVAAQDLYTQAIDLNPTKAVYWANRAQAEISTEQYGSAIADATMAIKLDPTYVKAYYRRAVSYVSVTRHSDALKDFRKCTQLAPNDKSARLRWQECNKLVRRLAFEAAIEVGDAPSAAEGLDLARMDLGDYDGARIEDEGRITQEFIDDMTQRFKDGKRLHLKYVYRIVLAVKEILTTEATMTDVHVEQGKDLTVCGDTHGQYYDLLNIFDMNGYPSEDRPYLFNGDFVDRGSWSTEVALTLFAYKWLIPGSMLLNRGNHESIDLGKVYGFEGECKHKYNERVFHLFQEAFGLLPLACLVDERYLVLHGGLFSDDKVTLEDLRNINRHSKKQPGTTGLLMEMLWTDPQDAPGRGASKRGVGLQFGPDVTKRFCENNNLKAIIRSHEVRMDGYEIQHDGRCITVFSAADYCDSVKNKGAFVKIDHQGQLNFTQYDAAPHPPIKPMAYASPVSFM
ncbi:Palmitoyl-protein thioesterase 1 [Savitreella phatthalungensis]